MEFGIGLFAHAIVWTEYMADSIGEDIRTRLYERLREVTHDAGCTCLAVNGASNHAHFLILFTVDTVIGTLVEDAKKQSAEWMNSQNPSAGDFRWAEGYAAFTISESDLPDLKKYLAKQATYHQTVSFKDELTGLLIDHEIEFDEQELFPERPAAS